MYLLSATKERNRGGQKPLMYCRSTGTQMMMETRDFTILAVKSNERTANGNEDGEMNNT